MKRHTTIEKRGAKRWEQHRHESRLSVMQRANGMCEAPRCPEEGTEWAHAFGRGHIIAEPLASCNTMTFWLCKPCHDRMDQRDGHDLGFQQMMRAYAVAMTIQGLGIKTADVMPLGVEEPIAVARAIERVLRAERRMK